MPTTFSMFPAYRLWVADCRNYTSGCRQFRRRVEDITMQRDEETPVQGLIELGQASVETRGHPIDAEPEAVGFKPLS
jgi:hypothetical protein